MLFKLLYSSTLDSILPRVPRESTVQNKGLYTLSNLTFSSAVGVLVWVHRHYYKDNVGPCQWAPGCLWIMTSHFLCLCVLVPLYSSQKKEDSYTHATSTNLALITEALTGFLRKKLSAWFFCFVLFFIRYSGYSKSRHKGYKGFVNTIGLYNCSTVKQHWNHNKKSNFKPQRVLSATHMLTFCKYMWTLLAHKFM